MRFLIMAVCVLALQGCTLFGRTHYVESRRPIIPVPERPILEPLPPEEELFTEAVTINTAFPRLRTEETIGIGYGDDVDKACQLAEEAILSVPEVLRHPAPTAWITDLAESSINLGLWWWTEPRRSDVVVVRISLFLFGDIAG